MERTFADNVALKIMANKLRGRPQEAIYELTDAELAILGAQLPLWTVSMGQVLANAVGDLDETQRIVSEVIALSELERGELAASANQTLDSGEVPPHREFAAFILSNHSDELYIAAEIARRESLQ